MISLAAGATAWTISRSSAASASADPSYGSFAGNGCQSACDRTVRLNAGRVRGGVERGVDRGGWLARGCLTRGAVPGGPATGCGDQRVTERSSVGVSNPPPRLAGGRERVYVMAVGLRLGRCVRGDVAGM